MQITIKASVGALGHNHPKDVMNTKAAMNVYFRSVNKPTLEVCAGLDQELVDAIKYIQKHALNLSQVDGLIRPGDTVAKWLVSYWKKHFKPKASPKPKVGLLAWEAEGVEGGPFHSRKLHIPTDRSGLTIGRGYDCAEREFNEVVKDLIAAGVPGHTALTLAQAVKLRGEDAHYFVIRHDMLDWEISLEAQVKLFERIYPEYERRAKRQYDLATKELKNSREIEESSPAWPELKQKIRDVLVDLSYRGDYTQGNRQKVFKAVRLNDEKTAFAFFSDYKNWDGVPPKRIESRFKHLQ